jgi:hypothetical protein
VVLAVIAAAVLIGSSALTAIVPALDVVIVLGFVHLHLHGLTPDQIAAILRYHAKGK